MSDKLSRELIRAVEASGGGPVQIDSEGNSFVVMSIDAYLSLAGLDSEAELDASLAAVQTAMEEVRAGKARPMRDVLDELKSRLNVSR